MRRHEKQMTKNDALELLEKGEYGVLSLVGDDGYPYGVPVNYVYKNGFIYFHSASEGHKVDRLRENSKVSFCVVGDTEVLPSEFSTKFESIIVFGKVKEVVAEEDKRTGLFAIIHKYSFKFMDKGRKYIEDDYEKAKLYKIEIEHFTGKKTIN